MLQPCGVISTLTGSGLIAHICKMSTGNMRPQHHLGPACRHCDCTLSTTSHTALPALWQPCITADPVPL